MDKNQSERKELLDAWNRFVDDAYNSENVALILDSVGDDEKLHEFHEVLDRVWQETISNTPPLTEEQEEACKREFAQLIAKSESAKRIRPVQYPSPTITRFRKIWYAAAAALLLGLLIPAIQFFLKPKTEQAVVQYAGAIVGQAMPSTDIQLISGEKVVELKQNAQIELKDGHISIVEESDVSKMLLSENVMNKLIVPAGKRSSLQLGDGTKIWLNSGTELDFPSKFAGRTREISVKGEIYIEVEKGHQPFYVNTSKFRVQVHGTKFNISAYGENEDNSVVLVEGSVEIVTPGQEPTWLAPNERAAIIAGDILKETVNVDEYTSWKEGVLIFNKTPISEILKKIGRYYNVHFEDRSGNELFSKTCTGELILSEDFEELMISLSLFFSMQYHREGDIIYLRKK